MKIGVVGAGIMGRLLAWQLSREGHTVSLFDRDKIDINQENGHAAAFTAAGMLTPISEAECTEEVIVRLGLEALNIWPEIVENLNRDVDFHQSGSLILAHQHDHAETSNFRQQVARIPVTQNRIRHLHRTELGKINIDLGQRFNEADFIADEAWLSPLLVMSALAKKLQQGQVEIIDKTEIKTLNAGLVKSDQHQWHFDYVIDCRGIGAKPDLSNLRGVRGEVIWLHAPEVDLHHLIRLMHPRYRIYIVPRANNHYVIGATQIESASTSPITVRSALELLSAAYSVHPGFAEASIIDTRVSCRPAFIDNLPKIINRDGLMRINGLFRHGFLLAPALMKTASQILNSSPITSDAVSTIVETEKIFAT